MKKFGLDPARPVLLITGGSQGALFINEVVAKWIDAGGADGIQLLWATGRATYGRFSGRHAPPASRSSTSSTPWRMPIRSRPSPSRGPG